MLLLSLARRATCALAEKGHRNGIATCLNQIFATPMRIGPKSMRSSSWIRRSLLFLVLLFCAWMRTLWSSETPSRHAEFGRKSLALTKGKTRLEKSGRERLDPNANKEIVSPVHSRNVWLAPALALALSTALVDVPIYEEEERKALIDLQNRLRHAAKDAAAPGVKSWCSGQLKPGFRCPARSLAFQVFERMRSKSCRYRAVKHAQALLSCPLSGSAHHRAMMPAATAACADRDRSIAPIDVRHDPERREVAISFLQESNATLRRTVVAMLRVSGPTTQTVLFETAPARLRASETKTTTTLVARYHTCVQGLYFARVRVVIDTLLPEAEVGNACVQLHLHPLHDTDRTFTIRWDVDKRRALQDQPRCDVDGYWSSLSPPNSHQKLLEGRQLQLQYRFRHLKYTQPEQQRPSQSSPSLQDIFRTTCFLGDSQMRNLLNGIHPRCRDNATAMQAGHDSCPGVRYFVVNFAGDLPKLDASEEGACRVVVANFGQWDASRESRMRTATGARAPLSLSAYAAAIGSFVANLPPHLQSRLVWMTTTPRGMMTCGKDLACPNNDWRHPHVLQAFNDVAFGVMRSLGVPVWDTWRVLKDILDLSFDGIHYSAPFITDALIPSLRESVGQVLDETPLS